MVAEKEKRGESKEMMREESKYNYSKENSAGQERENPESKCQSEHACNREIRNVRNNFLGNSENRLALKRKGTHKTTVGIKLGIRDVSIAILRVDGCVCRSGRHLVATGMLSDGKVRSSRNNILSYSQTAGMGGWRREKES